MSKGIITQVIGAVVDVKFDGELPEYLQLWNVKIVATDSFGGCSAFRGQQQELLLWMLLKD